MDISSVEYGVLVVAVLLVGAGVAWLRAHNRFVRQRQHVDEAWRDVDVELRRRHDLVPRLVEVVQAHAAHERDLVAALVQERGPVSGQVAATAQAYPALRADRHFLELQRQLAVTEDRLAAARRIHAANLRAYNTRVETVPTSLVARAGRFRPVGATALEPPTGTRPPG